MISQIETGLDEAPSIPSQNQQDTSTTLHKYDLGYRILHWLMAAMFYLMFMAGFGFADATNREEHMTMLIGHSSIGTLISLMLLIRVTKRFIIRSPRPEHKLAKWQKMMAKGVQFGLYACMVFIPVTGYFTANMHELPVMLFGSIQLNGSALIAPTESFSMMKQAHEFGIILMMLLLILHIGAAIYHKVVQRDRVLNSMM